MTSESSTNQPPSTPEKKDDVGIRDSIAALRSILMIDTPTKSLLAGGHPSIATQQYHHKEQQVHRAELQKLQNTTSQLKSRMYKISQEAAKEARVRKTLQTTYDSLSKHKKELATQLELVTKSRNAVEKKVASVTKALQNEREAIAQERVQWKPEIDRLKRERDTYQKQATNLQLNYKSLDEEREKMRHRLNQVEKELIVSQEELKTNQSSRAALQPRLDQSQTACRKAEESLSKLEEEMKIIKRRHQKSLGSMLAIQAKIKVKLREAEIEKKNAEENLKKAQEEAKGAKKNVSVFRAESQEASEAVGLLTNSVESLEKELQMTKDELQKVKVSKREEVKDTLNDSANSAVAKESDGVQSITIPRSLVALDSFIQQAVDNDGDDRNIDFLQQLARLSHGIKSDLSKILAEKQEAESQLSVRKSASEKADFEHAGDREKLRATCSELADAKEELEELRTEKEALEKEISLIATGKRRVEDNGENEGENVQNHIDSKRQKKGHGNVENAEEDDIMVV